MSVRTKEMIERERALLSGAGFAHAGLFCQLAAAVWFIIQEEYVLLSVMGLAICGTFWLILRLYHKACEIGKDNYSGD